MKPTIRLLLLAAALALSACGNKGDLVLPDQTPSPATDHKAAPPAPSSSVPASPAAGASPASPASPAG
ncbi:MAG: lipoprotein [Proteobacteria bacterium]|nr:lipoprotein [Pseudomonadota bacterium]